MLLMDLVASVEGSPILATGTGIRFHASGGETGRDK